MTTLDSSSFDPSSVRAPDFQFNMTVSDLYQRDGLLRVDQAFLDYLHEGDASLYKQLKIAREQPDSLQPKDESALLIEVAAWLDDFIAKLFNIETEIKTLAAKHHELAPLYFASGNLCSDAQKVKSLRMNWPGLTGWRWRKIWLLSSMRHFPSSFLPRTWRTMDGR
ncbi:MAG: hypothetical protein R3E36_10990 [Nitrosomonas sp.]|nr:hypothetical protein [Nitrosomonas sp.]